MNADDIIIETTVDEEDVMETEEVVLSIVIVNYNVKYFLEQCLLSIEAATRGMDGLEVFVVDNASTDGSLAYLQPKFPNVEFIANPAGSLWELMHVNNPWGGSVTLANALRTGARAAAVRTGEGFSVELVLPLQEFHGVWCRRPPRPGDRFEFILVRTRLDNGVYTKNSPVPFLYDGHNIFGYIRAELGAPGEEGSTAPEKD